VEGRPLEESELIEKAKQGDLDAFEQLVVMHQAIAHRVAFVLTSNGADAQDAVQEAFLKAHRALRRFRSGSPFRPWLLRIVSNEAKNRMRTAGRHTRLELRLAQGHSSGDAASSPEDVAVANERRADLLAAVSSLKNKEREVITHRFLMGLSEQETAAVLGIPKGTVKSRLSRALESLRIELGPEARDWFEEERELR
jgi:RNA polymerase sigma factor (sigma-70 family)